MKKIFAVSTLVLTSFSAFAVPAGPCGAQAMAITRAVIGVTYGARIAREAQYSVIAAKPMANKLTSVTVQAFALNGDDSDTYEEHTFIFGTLSNGTRCYGLKASRLTAQN